MSRLIIKGGKKLSGEFAAGGNKNAVLPMLAACALTAVGASTLPQAGKRLFLRQTNLLKRTKA